MRDQIILNNYDEMREWFKGKNVLLVSGRSLESFVTLKAELEDIKKKDAQIVRFDGFKPNPTYESVLDGLKVFKENGCDAIAAIGGGSAMDVAKCIKMFSNMDSSELYLNQKIVPNDIPFFAIPTTAGTGSEATRFAVIYYKGEKQSVVDESCIPDTVLFDPECLKNLPLYQKKATMLDALSHAIESYWNIKSNDESKEYARKAIEGVIKNMDGYLANSDEGIRGMIEAAFIAGKAINITQTTAGHAMCYKITTTFGVSHGHATMLCNRVLYPWMIENADKCKDTRGKEYLLKTFDDIGKALGADDALSGAKKLNDIFDKLDMEIPVATKEQYDLLKSSVNIDRLNDNPVTLDENTIDILYHKILR
ncbi:MAG: phosphonoacetaldehyde reductase [Lachnospiraceae bacterium]|nr:phosphonoacetaldehyde reductase [Lachnospiraceae bacterium]